MDNFKAQEQAVFRGVVKALMLGIAVVFAILFILGASCWSWAQSESVKAKAEAAEMKRKADERYQENLRRLHE